MRLIFLDIDGVLNDHRLDPLDLLDPLDPGPGGAGAAVPGVGCVLLPRCVEQLGRVVARTGAKVVLSSSWRHLVHEGLAELAAFEGMLRDAGV